MSQEDEFLVLACDGVFDCISSQQLVDFVRVRVTAIGSSRKDEDVVLSKVISELFDSIISLDPKKNRGVGTDNMSCIIVLLDSASVSVDRVQTARVASQWAQDPLSPKYGGKAFL